MQVQKCGYRLVKAQRTELTQKTVKDREFHHFDTGVCASVFSFIGLLLYLFYFLSV